MNVFKKIDQKFIWLGVGIIFLIIIDYFYLQKIFAIHFVDEEDNLVLGKLLIDKFLLYKDLFSHHQPLAYILSSFIQQSLDLNSIYLLIKRHREFMIAYSSIWALFLVYRFGWRMLGTVIFFELSKIYLFGNLFLAESFVAYPLIYLTALVFQKDIKIIEFLFIGLVVGFVLVMLSPIWPLTGFLIFMLVFGHFKKQNFFSFLLGVLMVILVVVPFISIKDYIFNAFYINFNYYIPITSGEPFIVSVIKSFFTPINSFFTAEGNAVVWLVRIFSMIFFINLFLLIKRKDFKLLAIVLVILTLANIRYISPGLEYYQGFHLLPWLAIFLALNFMMLKKIGKLIFIFGGLLVVGFLLLINFNRTNLFQKNDLNNDFFINYSRQFGVGEVIRITKNDHDSLFVVPDEWLVYWQSNAKPGSKMINYYAWMEQVPPLKGEVDNMFLNNPPTFFYCACNKIDMEKFLNDYPVLNEYDSFSKDGVELNLFVQKGKKGNLTTEQLNNLQFHNVQFKDK